LLKDNGQGFQFNIPSFAEDQIIPSPFLHPLQAKKVRDACAGAAHTLFLTGSISHYL
jgi:hypothetical protein